MSTMDDRALALAGLAQALRQVRRIADTGQSDAQVVTTALESVFRIDAPSAVAVYGDVGALRPGLHVVRDRLAGQGDDPMLARLAMAVVRLERRFSEDAAMARRVRDGVVELAPGAGRLGSSHPEVLAALGTLYADTVSHLRPRVLVQGNPHYLAQPGVVAEIRAVLLAALRSAVLWRQLGGSPWDFLLRRGALSRAVAAHLA